ncbi:MAG TPA: hypothetical protein VGA69_11495 [Nitriliruptorales bacterium]
MATIRAVCTDCGDEVDLQPREITLVVADERATDPPRAGSYGFTCPECQRYVVKPADARSVGLLIAGGVEPSHMNGALKTAARRRAHPEAPPAGGAAITYDDVIDLHLLLEREDWFQELLAITSDPSPRSV